jgi:small subunit ribosomal protein S20
MPNHKSAEKRERQNKKKNAINAANRTRLRSQIRKLRQVLAHPEGADVQATLSQTISVIDKSVQKGVIHRNTASRHKARLTQRVNQAQAK